MKARRPSPVEVRTTPSALIESDHASRLDMNPAGRTNVNPIRLARIATSPSWCHLPIARLCSTSSEDSFTMCRTPEALAARAAKASSEAMAGPELSTNRESVP
jgi:hypothetical protein